MSAPRYLVLMGSGETSPTMSKTHRELVAATKPKHAILLDTPAGFQENVSIVSTKAIEYFQESVNLKVSVASVKRAEHEKSDPLAFASAISSIDAADWVFAGPGSPTFAVRQWAQTAIPALLAAKLANGGVVILASAAACTAGKRCVPVYEIYKCGYDPEWLSGMNLLASIGLDGVTVIPHFDNTEGTNHDTRFCYLGEPRLHMLEALLDPGETILGIDEHTGLVIDLVTRTAKVTGNGMVTVRRNGSVRTFPTGAQLTLAALMDDTEGDIESNTESGIADSSARTPGAEAPATPVTAEDPLAVEVRAAASDFDAAVATRSSADATAALLRLDASLAEWGRDQTSTPERFAAMKSGTTLRQTLIVRLGEFASTGLADPKEARQALVDLILQLRASARAEKRWSDSDSIRDGLIAAGIEVRDTANGVEWDLR
jgi:cyanophycinase-like exopeptidase